MTVQSSIAEIEQILLPNVRDLGDGFRGPPRAATRRSAAWWGLSFFSTVLGRLRSTRGEGLDVRPHPHIGLSTVTYLLEGAIVHRDSEGYVQTIKPGEVNLMTAGRGIVHSERSGPGVERTVATVAGLQKLGCAARARTKRLRRAFNIWVPEILPFIEGDGARVRVIAGTLHGKRAPTNAYSDLFNADVSLNDGATFRIDAEHIERGIFIVSGAVEITGQTGAFGKDRLVVFKPGAEIVLRALGATRMMVLGGEPLSEPRHIFWNFVSSSRGAHRARRG